MVTDNLPIKDYLIVEIMHSETTYQLNQGKYSRCRQNSQELTRNKFKSPPKILKAESSSELHL